MEVGRLELTGPETEREQGGDILVFDPTRVTDGIDLSDDQILRFRPRAYSASGDARTARGAERGLDEPGSGFLISSSVVASVIDARSMMRSPKGSSALRPTIA